MGELENRTITLDLERILWDYAKANLKDFTMELAGELVIDSGKRRVCFQWYAEKKKEK